MEKYINDSEMQDCDPLIKMAMIHFQFESIHPFYDGNGRTGRIINILYLILEGLQSLPILYLSNYIIKHKADYYRLLQKVRDENLWEEWLLLMIKGIEITAKETIELIIKIKDLMLDFKHKLRDNYKFYSQDLLNNLFKHHILIDKAKINAGYKLRFESAVEDKKYHVKDLEIPLTTEALAAKSEGTSYIKYVRFSARPWLTAHLAFSAHS